MQGQVGGAWAGAVQEQVLWARDKVMAWLMARGSAAARLRDMGRGSAGENLMGRGRVRVRLRGMGSRGGQMSITSMNRQVDLGNIIK